ncbi:hypothetical protein R80B4_01634 [Fibrobacteres bacterium R8-0-B4]
MSIVTEIKKTVSAYEQSRAEAGAQFSSSDYQELFDMGIIKPRGYTIQTIDERQRNILKKNISYSLRTQP